MGETNEVNMKKPLLVFVGLISFALFGVTGERHDDYYNNSSSWASRAWNYSRVWRGAEWPHDGGLMTGSAATGPLTYGDVSYGWDQWNWTVSAISMQVDDLELGGMDFKNMTARLYGKDITMVGDAPYIRANAHDPYFMKTDTTHDTQTFWWMWIDLTFKGLGDAPLTMKGAGPLMMTKQPLGFSHFEVAGGTLVVTNHNIDFSSAVPLHLTTGKMIATPPDGASMPFNELVSRDGHGVLAVTNNATLDITELKRQKGGILDVRTSNGGKVVAQNLPTGNAIDGGLISLSGNNIKFLDNSAENGLVVGSGTPANARVLGTASDAAGTVSDTGNISEEYIYRPALSGASTINVNGAITSPNGVTIASPHSSGTVPTVKFTGVADCGADIRFQGVSASFDTPAGYPFNESATLSTLGRPDVSPAENGRLSYSYGAGTVISHKFKLGGYGSDGWNALSFANKNWDSGVFSVKGAVELLGDTAIKSTNQSTIDFYEPVTGQGGLRIGGGRASFRHPDNNFAGEFYVTNSWVFFRKDARLKCGDFSVMKNAKIIFSDISDWTLTNYFTGASGNIYIQNSKIGFYRPTTVDDLRVLNAHTQDVVVTFHRDFKANMVIADESYAQPSEKRIQIKAADRDIEFTVGNEDMEHAIIGSDLTDGDEGGRLSLVKVGGNSMLTISGTNNTYTGKTRILGGTLRLGAGVFSPYDASIWLDASDESSIQVNDQNRVTRWTDKYGKFYFYGENSASYPGPLLAVSNAPSSYMNNHPFVRFKFNNGSPYERLVPGTSTNANIRTVFAVCRGRSGSAEQHVGGGFIQYNSADVSVRTGTSGGFSINYEGGSTWPSGIQDVFQNGKKWSSSLSTTYSPGANTLAFFNVRVAGGSCNSYEHVDEFRPWLAGNDRIWGGDMAELIFYPRLLNTAECYEVINYLMKKWNPEIYESNKINESQIRRERVNFLPPATEVEIATDAILDLNGSTQTVWRISGEGVITNSSPGTAVLTVTDTSSFRGTVTGDIIFTVPTADAEIRVRDGAALVMSGAGTGEVKASNAYPPTHSLQCWVDASLPDTIVTDTDGNVMEWRCKPGVECAGVKFTASAADRRPSWDANGMCENKPGVSYTAAKQVMTLKLPNGNDAATWAGARKVATMFYVTRFPYPALSTAYAFALSGNDQGLVVYGSSNSSSWRFAGMAALSNEGDLCRLNGVNLAKWQSPSREYAFTGTGVAVFAARFSEAHLTSPNITNLDGPVTIGTFSGDRGARQCVAEVICYTNRLSDLEFYATEKYLMDKWLNSGTSWPEPETVAVADGSTLGVAGGAVMDLGDAQVSLRTLGGDGKGGGIKASKVTVTDGFVFYPIGTYGQMRLKPIEVPGDLEIGDSARVEIVDYEGLERYYRHEALSVGGSVIGDNQLGQDKTNVTAARWKWARSGNSWCVIFDNSIGITIW